jgi:hypothetical protein
VSHFSCRISEMHPRYRLYATFKLFGRLNDVATRSISLLPTFLSNLPLPFACVALDDGVLTVHDGAKTWVLVSAQLKGDV